MKGWWCWDCGLVCCEESDAEQNFEEPVCGRQRAPAVAPIVKSRCRTGLLARQLHLNNHNERFLTQSFIYSCKAGCSILFSPKRMTILRIIYSSFTSKQEMQRHEKKVRTPSLSMYHDPATCLQSKAPTYVT